MIYDIIWYVIWYMIWDMMIYDSIYDMMIYDDTHDIWYDMIYLIEIGLTPGGSSTVHSYTHTVHRTTHWNRIHRTEHT